MPLSGNPETISTLDQTTSPVNPSDSVTGLVGYQITGTCNHVYTPQVTVDGTNWVGALWVPSDSTTAATTIAVSGAPASVVGRVDAGGFYRVRLKATTVTSGSAVVRNYQAIG